MRTLRFISFFVCALLSGSGNGCGRGATGVSITGTLNGQSYKWQSAFALEGETPVTPPPQIWLTTIVITNYPDACSAGPMTANGSAIELSFTSEKDALQSGTYSTTDAGSGNTLSAVVEQTNASCEPAGSDTATSGSVTLDVLPNGEVRGILSLTFPDGALTGSFDAPPCGSADASANGTEAGALGDAGKSEDGAVGDAGKSDASGPMACP